jgi:hypothetical protein
MEDHSKINRRDFLRITAGMGAALTCPSIITGCIFDKLPEVLIGYKPKVSTVWVSKDEQETYRAMFETMVRSATDINTWLSPGDRVFLKLAQNSPNPFPSTTDPWVLDCMIKLLQENGAGEIQVAIRAVSDMSITPSWQVKEVPGNAVVHQDSLMLSPATVRPLFSSKRLAMKQATGPYTPLRPTTGDQRPYI